ncbi:hypothetical protein HD_1739 [[Haemophilus] ducreyi 35000HP]|uniref:Uncharacterized protein n=1 Tax=Haemophilus ducreyi (strain 35000HP / ATCC 700724) TaxID=233412 RepID=Q7VKX2_HAEDU|nr:hypothetical protein HD_1739 [[Haemophilus] ducreyi 35000HP]
MLGFFVSVLLRNKKATYGDKWLLTRFPRKVMSFYLLH